MAKANDGQDPLRSEPPEPVNAVAISVALAAATNDERVARKADAFFDKRRELLEQQAELARLHIARMRAQDDHIEEEQRL